MTKWWLKSHHHLDGNKVTLNEKQYKTKTGKGTHREGKSCLYNPRGCEVVSDTSQMFY